MRGEDLKNGFYIIKADNRDSLSEEIRNKIKSLRIESYQKFNFKNLFEEDVMLKVPDLLVEIVGQNPFLRIKSIKNHDTGEDVTERFTNKDIDDVNCLWTLTKHLKWVIQ